MDSCDAPFHGGLGARTPFSYNHVLPANNTTAVIHANRDAKRGNSLHAHTRNVSSLSRAAIAFMTRDANHGLASSAKRAAPWNSSFAATRSCAASRQLSHEVTCSRPDWGRHSINLSTLIPSACFVAASSRESRNLPHSALFFFSRFHIPASLPPRAPQFPRALACFTTRRRARNSLTFTVFAFRSKTSAISSIENPSTSFSISISRSRSSNPASSRSTRCLASSLTLMSGPSFFPSAEWITCLACSSLRSDSYTSGRTFFFLSKSQHSLTVILYSQVLNAARWSNRFSEKYALTNTCCAMSSTSSRLRKIPPATANTRCWCRRTSSSNASLSSPCARRTSSRSSALPAGLKTRPLSATAIVGGLRGSTFGTRAIDVWLRLLSPDCRNPHHLFHFPALNFLLATHLTDME